MIRVVGCTEIVTFGPESGVSVISPPSMDLIAPICRVEAFAEFEPVGWVCCAKETELEEITTSSKNQSALSNTARERTIGNRLHVPVILF